MTEPILRRARLDDAETLSALGARTFTETFGHLYAPHNLSAFLADAYGLDATQRDLGDPTKAAWLMERDGRAIGYALAGPCALPHPDVTPHCGELKRFYLLKGWQGAGLGGRVFAAVMAWLQAPGPRDIWIGVWSQNLGAQRFYARHGFAKAGEYDFAVGDTLDREFILRRPPQG